MSHQHGIRHFWSATAILVWGCSSEPSPTLANAGAAGSFSGATWVAPPTTAGVAQAELTQGGALAATAGAASLPAATQAMGGQAGGVGSTKDSGGAPSATSPVSAAGTTAGTIQGPAGGIPGLGGRAASVGGSVALGGVLGLGGVGGRAAVTIGGAAVSVAGSNQGRGGAPKGGAKGSGGTGAGAGGAAITSPAGGGSTSGGAAGAAGVQYLGDAHDGNLWLGPVDFAETEWHNACSPYPASIQALYGNYIMGVSNEIAGSGAVCDQCAELTANGASLIAHVVTYGQETGPYDIDVSPEIVTALHLSGTAYKGSWRYVVCPTSEPIYYNFDGGEWSNTWFFRVWVRNSRMPVTKVEWSLDANSGWKAAAHQSDGAWQGANVDFGKGFFLRITSSDGKTIVDQLPGVGSFDFNSAIASRSNF